jgi:hypothetical protein
VIAVALVAAVLALCALDRIGLCRASSADPITTGAWASTPTG